MITFENKEINSINDLLSNLEAKSNEYQLGYYKLYTKIDDINNNPSQLEKLTKLFNQAAQSVGLLNTQETNLT